MNIESNMNPLMTIPKVALNILDVFFAMATIPIVNPIAPTMKPTPKNLQLTGEQGQLKEDSMTI